MQRNQINIFLIISLFLFKGQKAETSIADLNLQRGTLVMAVSFMNAVDVSTFVVGFDGFLLQAVIDPPNAEGILFVPEASEAFLGCFSGFPRVQFYSLQYSIVLLTHLRCSQRVRTDRGFAKQSTHTCNREFGPGFLL